MKIEKYSAADFDAMFPLNAESKSFDDQDLPDAGESDKDRMILALRKSASVPNFEDTDEETLVCITSSQVNHCRQSPNLKSSHKSAEIRETLYL
jgi:hypothetical protein